MTLFDAPIEAVKPDPLIDYLVDELTKARFEPEPDGTMWCSDSNATVDPHEMAIRIREILTERK